MKISVLLCVYNGQDFISKAIESILKQDFKEFEFLIINDGSNDITEKIIFKYVEIDSRIKYFYKEHTGLTDSLIYGLNRASGEWIARIDSDDFAQVDRLSKQLKFVDNNNKIVLLGSNFSVIREKEIIYKSNLPQKHLLLINNLKRLEGFFPHSSAFFSREKAIQVGGYRSSFNKAQDHDLWLRLSEVGEIACLSENLVLINEHQNRVTNIPNGYPQYIYAFAAIVSFYSRKERYSQLETDIIKNINPVLEKINEYLTYNKQIEIISFKDYLKKLLSMNNKFPKIIKIIHFIFKKNI